MEMEPGTPAQASRPAPTDSDTVLPLNSAGVTTDDHCVPSWV